MTFSKSKSQKFEENMKKILQKSPHFYTWFKQVVNNIEGCFLFFSFHIFLIANWLMNDPHLSQLHQNWEKKKKKKNKSPRTEHTIGLL